MLLDVLRTAYRWYSVNKAPFELLGFSLAVLGTLFAVLSIKDGQKLTKDLRTVFDHLTTREAGPFPAYMQEVDRGDAQPPGSRRRRRVPLRRALGVPGPDARLPLDH